MSSSAVAQRRALVDVEIPKRAPLRRSAAPRRTRARTALLPLSSVSLQAEQAASRLIGRIETPPTYVWLLAIAAIAIHAVVAWHFAHRVAAPVMPKKHEVQLDIVVPKPPEPKKIEPPKPEPPKPKVQRPAQVLPRIQEATPPPSDVPAAESSEPPVAVAPVASEPVEAKPEPVTPPIGRAGYLNNPPPDYPPLAARQSWEGTVTLRVHVLSTGKVDTVEVQTSSGRRILDEQAIRTVKDWLFTPSKRGDTPIDGWAVVPIEFKLEQ